MPFLATRAGIYGLDMKAELGFSEGDEGEWHPGYTLGHLLNGGTCVLTDQPE